MFSSPPFGKIGAQKKGNFEKIDGIDRFGIFFSTFLIFCFPVYFARKPQVGVGLGVGPGRTTASGSRKPREIENLRKSKTSGNRKPQEIENLRI